MFEDFPGVTVDLERVIPGPRVVIPYFWDRGVQADAIEAAFTDHPGVKRIELIDSIDDEYLLRVEWDPEYVGVLSTLAETQVPLINAVWIAREWTFEIGGGINQKDLAEFQRLCHERDIPVTMTELPAITTLETGTEAALTEAPQEALHLAYNHGYFNLPREVTMIELGKGTRYFSPTGCVTDPSGDIVGFSRIR